MTTSLCLMTLPALWAGCVADAADTNGADDVSSPTDSGSPPPTDTGSTPATTLAPSYDAIDPLQDPMLTACLTDADSWSASLLANGRQLVQTPHYRLEWAASAAEAEDAARQLEALRVIMGDYFGDPSTQWSPREVNMYATEQQFRASLGPDANYLSPGAGGFYSYQTERASLWTQGTTYYTRVLMLHEAVHQHQLKLFTAPQDLPWYAEGMAEYLSRHDWDGECLRLGARPLIARDDIFEEAFVAAVDGDLQIQSMIQQGDWDRPRAFAAIAGMARSPSSQTRADFDVFRKEMDAGLDDHWGRYSQLFGDDDQVTTDLIDWLENDQIPMFPVFIEWYPIDQTTIRAWAQYSSASLIKEPIEELSVQIPLPGGDYEYTGITVGYADEDNLASVYVHRNGSVSLFDVTNDQVQWDVFDSLGPLAASVSVQWQPNQGVLTIDGQQVQIPSSAHPVAAGLSLYGTDVVFTDIDITYPSP